MSLPRNGVDWCGVWSVVVAFTGHTNLLFCKICSNMLNDIM